jgi:hypothetical protein
MTERRAENGWLEVERCVALDFVAYVVAVFLRREPGCHPFTGIDAQSVSLNTLRVSVFALTPAIRYLKAFLDACRPAPRYGCPLAFSLTIASGLLSRKCSALAHVGGFAAE